MMLDRVSGLIMATLKKDGVVINENTDLIAELGLNSLDLAELACAFEDEFSVEIPDRDIGKFHVVGDIVDYLNNKGRA